MTKRKPPKKIMPPTRAEVVALEFRHFHNSLAACQELNMTAASMCVVLTKQLQRLKRGMAKQRRD